MKVTSRTLDESPAALFLSLSLFVLLGVPAAVDDVPSRWSDVDGVQDGPQDLAERSADAALKDDASQANAWEQIWTLKLQYLRRQDLGREVGDVGRDGPARQELGHLVGEGVAVVLKQAIPVTPVAEHQTSVNTLFRSFFFFSSTQILMHRLVVLLLW